MKSISGTNWKREPWVWLLIGLPLSAVIAGFYTLYLAIESADGLVVDDYYKQGKEINQTLERDHRAALYKLSSGFRLDPESGRLHLSLDAVAAFDFPERVTLRLLHPTIAGRDQMVIMVSQGDGEYVGLLPDLSNITGRWYIQLEADDWRLTGTAHIPVGQAGDPAPTTFGLQSE